MITKVSKETPFQVLTSSFSISPSAEGYTLQISADGKNYSNLFSVPANTTRLVTNVAANSFYRLSGNNSEVVVNWQKSCGGGGSADLTNYYTKEETDERIQEAVTSGVSLDGYWTSAETKDYVDASISGISVDLSGYYTSGQTDAAIATATANLVTSGDVQTQIESYDYATKQYVDNAISGISLDGYWTSAETKTYVDNSISDVSGDFGVLSGIVQEQQEVVSRALNDLNDRVVELSGSTVDLSGYYTSGQTDAAIATATANLVTSGDVQTQIDAAVQNKVSSSTITTIWTGTQAEYDLIANPDPNTFYAITGTTA